VLVRLDILTSRALPRRSAPLEACLAKGFAKLLLQSGELARQQQSLTCIDGISLRGPCQRLEPDVKHE